MLQETACAVAALLVVDAEADTASTLEGVLTWWLGVHNRSVT